MGQRGSFTLPHADMTNEIWQMTRGGIQLMRKR